MTIRIPLVWCALALFALIEGTLLYEFHRTDDKWKQTIIFSASIVAAAFGLFSYLKGIEERRRHGAEKMAERWNDPSILLLKDFVREITEEQAQIKDYDEAEQGGGTDAGCATRAK